VADTVFVGTGNGALYGLDRGDGVLRWEHQLSGSATGQPAVDSGVAYVPGGDAVWAYDEAGERRWQAPVVGASTASLAPEGVYVADERGLAILEPGTGEEQWRVHTSAVGAPAIGDSFVFTGGRDGAVHAHDRGGGDGGWYYRPGGFEATFGPPVLGGDTVYAMQVSGREPGIHALAADSGDRRWHYGLDDPGWPVAAGRDRVYATDGGRVVAVSPTARLEL